MNHTQNTPNRLSWLRKQPGRFLVGSSCGVVHLCQVGADRDEGGLAARSIVRRYETFPKLTSIHGNCEDQVLMMMWIENLLNACLPVPPCPRPHIPSSTHPSIQHPPKNQQYVLVSGYSHDVRLYDMETGAVVRTYAGIHEDHINISRFANHSPNLFATSSFDRTMKLWDLRCKVKVSWVGVCESRRSLCERSLTRLALIGLYIYTKSINPDRAPPRPPSTRWSPSWGT